MNRQIPTSAPQAKRPFHILSKPVGPVCNLDCEYCFYLDKTQYYPGQKRFEMDEATLEAHVRDYIASQPRGCQEVVFGWQGGEPTLRGVAFFEKVVALQRRYARPGMAVRNTLQTNAVLIDDEWGRFLREHGFLVGVSIDGDAELHDRYRKTRSGKGSHKKVIKGLKCLLRHGVEVNVLTVVQRDNGDHGRRVYEYLTSLGVQFIQFIPVVEAQPGEGISERSVTPAQFGRFMTEVFDAWRERDIGRVFVSHFDNALGMTLGMPSNICVHAPQCGDNLVVEHNGDVYSCDHFVYPEFKLGSIRQQGYPDLIETPLQVAFSRRKPTGSELHCRGCAVRNLCNGACPAQRLDEKGNLSVSARHYLCEGYFAFFSHLRPYLNAMAACLQRRLPASEYRRFMPAPQA